MSKKMSVGLRRWSQQRLGEQSAARELNEMGEMNMTPLIDVMLVLIIMMIMTIPIQNHSVILNMPIEPAVISEPVVSTINVDFDGAVLWDGELVPSRAALEDKLKAIAAKSPQNELHIGSHKMVEYKNVAAVLASAQRLGVTNIGLVGNEQFVE